MKHEKCKFDRDISRKHLSSFKNFVSACELFVPFCRRADFKGAESERERKKVFVGNLSYDARERDVEQLFERFGRIRSVSLKVQ